MFTKEDGKIQVEGTIRLLLRAQQALAEGRFVEANGWYELAVSELEGDIFPTLAGQQANAVTNIPN